MISKGTDFNQIVEKVKSFYKEYDATFLKVDCLFEKIDENTGKINGELKEIQTILRDFYENYSELNLEENELQYDNVFKELLDNLGGDINENEYLIVCKKIQNHFRNYSAIDTKRALHRELNEVIHSMFTSVCNIQNQNIEFKITKILRELVADDLLICCGISPLYYWNYGTDSFSSLTAEEQLVVVLNQSIMIDRLHNSHHLLKTYLEQLNKLIGSFYKLDWFVYFVAGFLNFKIHNYLESREFFEKVELYCQLRGDSIQKNKNRYFHSMLLIAYGFEYNGQFPEAIKKIATSVDTIKQIIIDIPLQNINSEMQSILDIMLKQCDEKSIFHNYFKKGSSVCEQIENCLDSEEYKIRIEILHALAHCLNEYAIKSLEGNINIYAKFIRLSRAIMSYIATENHEYWTCYATIHGECKDYDKALIELNKAKVSIGGETGKIKETLIAEIDFFDYYFHQMLHQSVNEERRRFLAYCDKYLDDDAKCHIEIFEFRSDLRNYLATLFDELRQKNQEVKQIKNLPNMDHLSKAYKSICKLQPSLYMNVNVRAELRLMQRIYVVIVLLKEYLSNPSKANCTMLLNSCKRFWNVKKEYNLAQSNDYLQQDCSYCECETYLPKEVCKTLFGSEGIVHCLNTSDSVFILAPISGVVVYQYQTGNIDELFDVKSLLRASSKSKEPLLYNKMAGCVAAYYDAVAQDEQERIAPLNWELLKKYKVTNVFFWSSEIPVRLLETSENKSISRWLTNPVLFEKTIENALDSNIVLCTQGKKSNKHCQFRQGEAGWLEIINESEKNISIFLQRKEVNGVKTFLIVCGDFEKNDCCRHAVHNILSQISIEQIYDCGTHLGDTTQMTLDLEKRVQLLSTEIKSNYKEFQKTKRTIEQKERDLDNHTPGKKGYLKGREEIDKLNDGKESLHNKIANKIIELYELDASETRKLCKNMNLDINDFIKG